MARSYKDQFIRALREYKHEKASFKELAEKMGPKWPVEKVEAKARLLDADDSIPIAVTRGGVLYFGSETGKQPGLYKEVQRGIEHRWGPDNGMQRLKGTHTSRRSTRGDGDWTQPDLVVRVKRRSNARPPVVFLAVEIEQPNGFGIESVYQAYELGRGADFSWVFYAGPACAGRSWNQIAIAARDLGVGVVHAARPTAPAAWKTQIKARNRNATRAQRSDFLRRSRIEPGDFAED